MRILGYELRQTCGACPEQYDVFWGAEKVGYLRLRHGGFTAETPGHGFHLVYEVERIPGADGCFDNEVQRAQYLQEAIRRIHEFRAAQSKSE